MTGAGSVLVKQWGSVELILLVEAEELALCFDMGDRFEFWELATIVENWRARANLRCEREVKAAANADLAHADRVDEWTNHTRAVAHDVRAVYGDRLANLMLGAAQEVESAVSWAAKRVRVPKKQSLTAVGRAKLFLAIDLWAFDRLREVVDVDGKPGIPGLDAGRLALLRPVMEHLAAEGFDTVQQAALAARVRSLEVLPGETENLMADVLFVSREGGGSPKSVHFKKETRK